MGGQQDCGVVFLNGGIEKKSRLFSPGRCILIHAGAQEALEDPLEDLQGCKGVVVKRSEDHLELLILKSADLVRRRVESGHSGVWPTRFSCGSTKTWSLEEEFLEEALQSPQAALAPRS